MSATRHLPVVSAWANERAREERERGRIATGYYERPPPEDDAEGLDDLDGEGEEDDPVEEPEADDEPAARSLDRHTHERVRHPGGPPRFLTDRELDDLDVSLVPTNHARPRTRGDCIDGPRPCPYVGCRHHLYLEVDERGAIRVNFPGIDPDEMAESCALDVADRGGRDLDRVGDVLNVTYERVRQVEEIGIRKMKRSRELRAALDGEE